MKGKNQKDLKEENTSTVLRLVRDNPQISRIDVVRLTHSHLLLSRELSPFLSVAM